MESQLANLRRAAEPFRRAFDLPYVETEAVGTRVRLLPTPLYVAYAQLKHAQQNGEDARVEILGSTDDAEAFARRPTSEEGEIATAGGEETDNRRHNKRRRGEGGLAAAGRAAALAAMQARYECERECERLCQRECQNKERRHPTCQCRSQSHNNLKSFFCTSGRCRR